MESSYKQYSYLFVCLLVSVTSSTLLLSPPWASPVRSGRYVLSAQFMGSIILQYAQSNSAFIDYSSGRSARNPPCLQLQNIEMQCHFVVWRIRRMSCHIILFSLSIFLRDFRWSGYALWLHRLPFFVWIRVSLLHCPWPWETYSQFMHHVRLLSPCVCCVVAFG